MYSSANSQFILGLTNMYPKTGHGRVKRKGKFTNNLIKLIRIY